jgi:hypothetical protein
MSEPISISSARDTVRANLLQVSEDAHAAAADGRAYVHRVGQRARSLAGDAVSRARAVASRAGALAESYVGDKIKRRVKPPIVTALVIAGVALAVAVVAVAIARQRG